MSTKIQRKNFIFSKCLLCGEKADLTPRVCLECYQNLPWNRDIDFKFNFNSNFNFNTQKNIDAVFYLLDYTELTSKYLQHFKYYQNLIYGGLWLDILNLNSEKLFKFLEQNSKSWLWTYVPQYSTQFLMRGFNQTHWLLSRFAKQNKLYFKNILKRTKWVKRQNGLSRKQRLKNMDNVFEIINSNQYKNNLKNQNIVLFEDVITTGSTVKSCAKALKKVGVNKIVVVSLMRVNET